MFVNSFQICQKKKKLPQKYFCVGRVRLATYLVTFSKHPGFAAPVGNMAITENRRRIPKNENTPMTTHFSSPTPRIYTSGKAIKGRTRKKSIRPGTI